MIMKLILVGLCLAVVIPMVMWLWSIHPIFAGVFVLIALASS